ncbi:MAG: TonB-dependent receptor, partial [Gammaproteobacteria bacterium]|nr:TonB-dependent receptor [Gammaproteobacteria bacterium]
MTMKQFNQPGWLVPAILGITLAINQAPARSAESQTLEMEEVTVWGQKNPVLNTSRNSPQTKVTPDDLVGVNTVMTEDLVKYEPGVIVRQRYIGDSNGTLGMRGSNMFQTTRSMVFADGVPLHYFLQTRWSGAPRWSLVSADEISEVTVIYGPFSAEYGGNAMGGVVNIETAIPVDRQIRLQATSFQQAFSDLGYDDRLGGNKYFASYGDRFESFSLYTSYNHVENLSQPMSFQFSKPGSPVGGELPVTGAVADSNEYGAPVLYFADAGETEAIADQFKFKLGHEYGSWLSVLHLAYEDRRMLQDAVNNYLRDSTGSPVWQGSMVQNGQRFSVSSDDFAISEQDRRSLLLGGRLQGQISDNWWMEAGFSRFRILEDETRNANANPADPAFTLAGDITDYEDTGWKTVNFKFFTNSLLNNDSLTLALGYQHEQYSLLIKNFDSSNFYDGIKTTLTHASGGKSKLDALYAQLGWMLGNNWDAN